MSCDLLPFRSDHNLLAAWLAGTNPTQFRRKIGEKDGRRISVYDMCDSIQTYHSKSFVIKVKLMYGAVTIYQRQVNHLYDETIRIMGLQHCAIEMFRKRFSSNDFKETIRKKGKASATVQFTDVEIEPVITSENIVELFSQSNTSVRNLEDITMRETMVKSTRWETCRYIDLDENFGTDDEGNIADFFDIGQSTIGENEMSTLQHCDTMEQTGCTIEELPIVEDSVTELATNARQTLLPASEDLCFNGDPPPSCTSVPELPPFTVDYCDGNGDSEAQITQSSFSRKKSNKKRNLMVNQKIFIGNKEYAQQLQNHEWTLRSRGPREDIVPLATIRFPDHSALQLLRNPVRPLSHALLKQTFGRNAHVRHMPLADTDDPMVLAALEGIAISQPTLKKTARPRVQRQQNHGPKTLDHGFLPHSNELGPPEIAGEVSAVPETNALFRVISEADLLSVLRNFWNHCDGSVKFSELEKEFRCRQEAAKVFAVLVVLHAKQQVHLVSNPDRSSIDAIEKGAKFNDIIMQLY